MRYAINIDENGRILSATYEIYADKNAIIVNRLPEGDITDWLYVDGEYVYDPLPVPEEPEHPTPSDYEARISALEAELEATKILLGVV